MKVHKKDTRTTLLTVIKMITPKAKRESPLFKEEGDLQKLAEKRVSDILKNEILDFSFFTDYYPCSTM